MPFAPLSTVQHRLTVGAPLPFNLHDADSTLLLARGQQVESPAQLQALLQRGAVVDMAELQPLAADVQQAPRAALPRLWQRCLDQVAQALQQASGRFTAALHEAVPPVQALIARDPDLAIFQVLQQGAGGNLAYGVQRSLQTAVTSTLVARRLGWPEAQTQRLFRVALTMNIAMLELQGQLARQTSPPTAAQRQALQTHPMRSVRVLEQAGVQDRAWLAAVLQHHEQDDGSGYPAGSSAGAAEAEVDGEVHALASLARRADVYTARLASRSARTALAADTAGRHMFMQEPGHPMTAALVREFGIYPPGCYVRLASGETGIVVQRGSTLTAPLVACLTDSRGQALATPLRRSTRPLPHAIVGIVGEGSVSVRWPLDRLAALVTA